MSIFSICMIGIGLSMDAFAVSIAKGMTIKKHLLLRYAFILAFFFGFFQALMPLLGWWAGSYLPSAGRCFYPILASYRSWDLGESLGRGLVFLCRREWCTEYF